MHKTGVKTLSIIIILTVMAGIYPLISNHTFLVLAQTSTDPWSEPANLSHSGAATTPTILVDTLGAVHVIWEDEFAGTMYTRRVDGAWQAPTAVEFPFSPYSPTLVPNERGWVHAFWVGEEQELFSSRVLTAEFGNPFAWEAARQLANAAIALDVTVDDRGTLHLVYLRPVSEEGFPAGIYYRRSTDNGDSWYLTVLLYDSAYFRSLTPEDANLHIASSGSSEQSSLYVTWDNRPRKQVFVLRSLDRGNNWEPYQEIAGPDPALGSYIPFNIQVSVQDGQALLLWQVGEPGGTCTQYYQASLYQGESWSEPIQMLSDTAACPQDNQFFNLTDGTTIMMTKVFERPYLLAWNGSQWSDPQAQSALVSFEDPEIYSQVILGCHQAGLGPDDELTVAGCDLGDGGDIWATSRLLGDAAEWFPPPPVWSEPVPFAESAEPISDLSVLVDEGKLVHTLWIQPADADTPNSPLAIHYARWDGDRWTRPQAVLSSDTGDTLHPSAALDPLGRLLVVWSDSASGELLFSWAEAERANSPLEWAPAQALPTPHPGADYPNIHIDDAGMIWVAYSIPLNEGRGVYLTRSEDGGRTWSEPGQAFDGVAEEWSMVGAPQLVRTVDGTLHLLWEQLATPTSPEVMALHYANSPDGGQTWSESDQVVEGSIAWDALKATGDTAVHILWQELRDGRPALLHRVSSDNGLTWARPKGLASFAEETSRPALTSDLAGRLHLLQTESDFSGSLVLSHWLWDGVRWGAGEALELVGQSENIIDQLAAGISADGELAAAFSSGALPSIDNQSLTQLNFTSRGIDIPEASVGTIVQPETALEVTPTAGPTSTPEPASTPEVPKEPDANLSLGPIPLTNSWMGVVLGGGIAVFLVVLGFGVLLLIRRSR